MKRLMTAAFAATLMCGVSAYAYAQDNTQSPPPGNAPASGAMGSDQSTQGGMNPAPPNNAGGAQGSMSGGSMGQPAAPGSGDTTAAPPPAAGADTPSAPPPAAGPDAGAAPAAPMQGGQDMSGGAQAEGNTPGGQPPSNYPTCTHKGQDRCVQSGHMSSGGMSKHHKMAKSHHRMKSKKASAATSGGTAPASAPATPGAQ